MEKEKQKTRTENLKFDGSKTPGLYEITDLEESETVGYIGHLGEDITFYPKAGQAYSAAALARITREVMRQKKQAELRTRQPDEDHNGKPGTFKQVANFLTGPFFKLYQ